MKYRIDCDLPTIECCDVEYDWDEHEECCLICGDILDWEDAANHWDPDVLMEHDRELNGEEVDPYDDPNYDPPSSHFEKWLSTKYDPGEKEEEEEGSLFAGQSFYHGGGKSAGPKSPFLEKWLSTNGDKPKEDLFLNRDPPDEIL